MNTYLSNENIKAAINRLNYLLPTKNRLILIKIKNDYGLELFYDIKTNRQRFWSYAYNQVMALHDNQSIIINKNDTQGQEVMNNYIGKHYLKEWEFICKWNGQAVQLYLNEFCKANSIEYITVKAVIECNDYTDIFKPYQQKNIDKACLAKTADFAKIIDLIYTDTTPDSSQTQMLNYAIQFYLQSNRDMQKLHNFLASNKVI